jgi:predicted dehydrogenase
MPEKIGVAFVGCTHPHIFPRIQLLKQESDVQFVGCYDPDKALMAALELDHGLKAYFTPEALLDQPEANFVIIEGWDPDNPRYVEMAAARGQAILLEKPGAPNLTEMHRVIDRVRNAKIPFQVGYMLPFSAAIAHIKRIMAEGVLGSIVQARFHAATPAGGSAEIWQSVPGDLGGLMFTDACHAIHLMLRLLGLPQSVQATYLKLPAGADVTAHGFKKDTLSGLGATVQMPLGGLVHEDAGGAVFHYGDKLVTLDMTGWEAHPWVEGWTIELYGTDGTLYAGIQPARYRLYVRNPNHGYEAGRHNWDSFEGTGVGNSLLVDNNYTSEMQHMLQRVRGWDTDNTMALVEAEGVVTVLDAMFRSDRDGLRVAIEMR